MPLFINKMQWYKFILILLSWLGTPYKHFQMEKGKGADCGLFIAACLKEFGILKKVTYEYHPRTWLFTEKEVVLNHITDYIKNNFKENYTLCKVNDKLLKGDLLLFSLRSKVSNHLGIYLGNGFMINSINKRGVCVMPIFKNRITNVYRIYK